MTNRTIRRIIKNKTTGQLLITLTKKDEFKECDWVEIIKVPKIKQKNAS